MPKDRSPQPTVSVSTRALQADTDTLSAHQYTVDNGLRIVTVPMSGVYSASALLYVGVGSRHEPDELAGICHLVEHLAFKGTPRYPSPTDIALAIEGIGGVFNASTSRELTMYWAKAASHHVLHIVDVLFEITRHSLFRPEDIAKEKHIIVEEINEALDIPQEVAALACMRLLFPDHPLGRDVAGSRESVLNITREQIMTFVETMYRPNTMVLSVAGAVCHDEIVEHVASLVAGWSAGSPPTCDAAPPLTDGPHLSVISRPAEQVQLCVGIRGFGRHDEDRYALTLLNTLLGEGMSSRLFTRLREELGLAYAVGSSVGFYSDTGDVIIDVGVDAQHVGLAIEAICEELARLVAHPVPEAELNAAREFLKGRFLLSLEDTYANANWYGYQVALSQETISPEEAIAHIDALTPEDMQRVAGRLFKREQMALSIVGPVQEGYDWTRHIHL
ncbi:MAG: pitrilysin family protein [Ardenticatenia bacterium]|nr:pitrilysin family protein [Ardenticatenia bacterium]